MPVRSRLIVLLAAFVSLFTFTRTSFAVIRDGGVDPANLGQGGWLYIMSTATNKLGNTVNSVTNLNSLFSYLRGQGMNYVIVKAATSNMLWTGSGNVAIGSPNAQFKSNIVTAAHANGLLIFGSNRSWGQDIPGEVAVADYIFQQGADGFIWDAESEWETGPSTPWITNAPVQAWTLCSTVRAHWPNKFLAHNPYDTLYLHSSFPFKEFGYWADCVMPQVYHHSASKGNAIAAIHWTDVNYKKFQDSLYTLPETNIDGQTIYWTNSIKPLALMRDVYNGNAGTPVHPDSDVANFLDYLVADPNCVTAGGYRGSDYFRSELHSPGQWANIKAATVGNFSNIVNNIVVDDANTTSAGSWTLIKTISATTSGVTFSGATGTDTNSFGTNYWTKSQGTGSSYIQFAPNVLTAGDYDCYQWHPYRGDASTNVPLIINFNGGITNIAVDQQTNAGAWSFIGNFPFAAGTNGYLRFTDGFPESSSVAMVDGIKMMFVPPTALPTTPSSLSAFRVSSTQINLSWSDDSDNEANFAILRSTTNGGPYSTIGLSSRNSTNYSDTNVLSGPTYYYVVRAINYLGASTDSNQATPPTPPVVTKQPLSITVGQGGIAAFSVTATGGGPLFYQWKKDGNPLSTGGTIVGATSSDLSINGVVPSDAGTYLVVITNVVGSTSSVPVTLTVATIPPFMVREASDQIVSAGDGASFTVIANGTQPLLYFWKRNGVPLNDGGRVSGATTRSLTIAGALNVDQAIYSVFITNQYGSVLSSNAALTVIDPSIATDPVSQAANAGATIVFSVVATGTPTVNYQWKKNGTNVVNGGKISGALTSALTITNILRADVADYTVLVSNPVTNVLSAPAHLTVNDPVIVADPVSHTNVAGTAVTFTVTAYGTATLNYTWKKNGNPLSDGGNIVGATSSTLTLASVSQADAATYSVTVANSAATQASAPAFLTVIDPPAITTQPQSQTVARGTNIVLTVAATGTAPLSYQWRYNGTNIFGATKTSYSMSNVQTNATGDYSVFISNAGGTLLSSNAVVVVNVPFEIISVSPITRANSVMVNWITTSNSTSQVEYGLTSAMGYFSSPSSLLVTNHSILLTSLKPDTTYYCSVISRIGPIIISSNTTFFTSASIIVDNADARYNGVWTLGTASTDKYGTYYQYTPTTDGPATSTATYSPNVVVPGKYDVYTWYGWQTSRSTNTEMYVIGNGNSVTSRVDQTKNTGSWQLIAPAVDFAAGTAGSARVSNSTGETNRVVVADAFLFQYNPAQDIRTNGTVPDWWSTYYFGSTNINPQADSDGDGYSEFAEYVLGTAPNDPSSRLNLQMQRIGTNTLQSVFSPCLTGRNYQLQYTTNLGSSWLSAPSSLVLSNGLGVVTTTNAAANSFYRLSVTLAP